MSNPESSEKKTNSTNKIKRQRPEPAFMSMTWLRKHMKTVIYAVVLTFVISLFFIGYGTNVQNREREKAEERTKKEAQKAFELPEQLKGKENNPVLWVSYDNGIASLTESIDVKTINRLLKTDENYVKYQQLPEGYRHFVLSQLKERIINENAVAKVIEIFARLNNLVSEKDISDQEMLVQKDYLRRYGNNFEFAKSAFNQELEKNNMDFNDFKRDLFRGIAYRKVQSIYLAPVNLASTTEDFFRNYYETNKIRFKKDDQISFQHLLISPNDIKDSMSVDDEKIKAYYEANKNNYKSSKRADVYSIFIKTDDENIASITYSETDVENAYNASKNFRFTEPEEVKASHILIKPRGEGDDEKKFEEAKNVIQALYEKAINGEDFAKLAKENSEDTASAQEGGELGFFERGRMVKEFEEAAFSTEIGSITTPIKTTYGYHIIKVEDKKPEKVKPFEEVKDLLILELKRTVAEEQAKKCLDEVKLAMNTDRKLDTFIKFVKQYSNGASKDKDGKLPAFFKGEITKDYSDSDYNILKDEVCDGTNYINSEIEKSLFQYADMGGFPIISDVIKSENGYHIFFINSFAEPIVYGLSEKISQDIKDVLANIMAKEEAKKIAEKLLADNSNASIEDLANIYGKEKTNRTHVFENLGFSNNASLAYSDLGGIGSYSDNGRTYLQEFHKALMTSVKSKNFNTYLPVFETEFGWNIVKVTDYKNDLYEDYNDVKDTIKRISTLEPSESEINKIYEENKEKFDKPATRKVRQIVCDEYSIKKAIEEINNGAHFAMVAKKYSKDSSSVNGGLMPPCPKGRYAADLDEAIWKLNINEYTKEPIKINNSEYAIALLVEETPEIKSNLQMVSGSIRQDLQNNYRNEAWTYFMKGLMNQANIVRNQELIDLIK